jgi:hypothetical protein
MQRPIKKPPAGGILAFAQELVLLEAKSRLNHRIG